MEDRQRFAEEAAVADAAATARQEARRLARTVQEGEGASSRAARKKVDSERTKSHQHQQARKPLSAEANERRAQQQEVTARRRAERAAAEAAVDKQHKKLDKEQSKKAAQRLDYLLKQSSIFSKLQGAGHATNRKAAADAAAAASLPTSPPHSSKASGVHHLHDAKSAENSDEEEAEEEEAHVFLSKQPTCIEFGQLKPYQLEGLNWMIHLAEKGLNGILADGTDGAINLIDLECIGASQYKLILLAHRNGSWKDTAIYFNNGISL
jgi:SWI/SNF-related matrix-associated actin-dependent regulator of chromatin subfamily A member 5